MTWRGHTAAPRLGLDIAIAGRAGHAVAAGTQQHGRSAHTARAWIESLHVKAHIRAERHLRGPRQ